jgi:hypothetical protein
MSDQLNLHQRLLAIINDLGAIAKEGKYDAGATRFRYHAIDDCVDNLRPMLVKHGVTYTIHAVQQELLEYDHVTNYQGKEQHKRALHAKVLLEVTFFNADDPTQTMTAIAPGDGIDFADKSFGKAVSYALKTILLAIFQLRGQPDNEADGDQHESSRAQPPARAPQSPPQRTQQQKRTQSPPAAQTQPAGQQKPTASRPEFFNPRDYPPWTEKGIEAVEATLRKQGVNWADVPCCHRMKAEGDRIIPLPAVPLGQMSPNTVKWYAENFYVPANSPTDDDFRLRAALNLWMNDTGPAGDDIPQ